MYSKRNITYGPPETDSEDEYDGFSFGDDYVKKDRVRWTMQGADGGIFDALNAGNLELFRELQQRHKYNPDENIDGGFTPLLYACQRGDLDIVEYLLVDLKASPNKHNDSFTPLMLACDCDQNNQRKESQVVEKLVRKLLKHGAEINIADKYGTTAFMIACKHGYTSVVQLMIESVSLNDVDNMGRTPIYYAMENNHADIVKILVDAGADTSIPNSKGYTPKLVAQIHGFYDLLELLPKQKDRYSVPTSFLSYCTLNGLIPRLFLKSECPEYFQEIYEILLALQLENLLEFFAKGRVPLQDFLCMNNEQLKEIGILHPIYHIKIQKGLLDFHLHYYKAMSIARVNKSAKDNFYEILMIAANHLKDLVVIKSSIRYIKQNMIENKLGNITEEEINMFENYLGSYRSALNELRLTTKYLSAFSPMHNPLYIDYDDILKERKRRRIRRLFRYTTLIVGISVFICIKVHIL